MPQDRSPTVAMGAWIAMMIVMMLPSLSPRLWRYHRAVRVTDAAAAGPRTIGFCAAYLVVWAVVSAIVFVVGAALGDVVHGLPPLARFAPVATGAVIVAAGALQLTRWKAHHLAQCRAELSVSVGASRNIIAACREGARLGMHCTASCAGHTAILLMLGMMDPRAMFAMTAAITAERVAPAGTRVARTAGVLAMLGGVMLLEHAVRASLAAVR